MAFSQPHPGTSTVLVDELDAGGFKYTANSQIIWSGHRRLTVTKFSTSNRTQADRRMPSQILGTPIDKRSSRPDLKAR
jgi:hypothetical protein